MKTVNITLGDIVKKILWLLLAIISFSFVYLIMSTNTFEENVISIILIILSFLGLCLIGTYLKRKDEKK